MQKRSFYPGIPISRALSLSENQAIDFEIFPDSQTIQPTSIIQIETTWFIQPDSNLPGPIVVLGHTRRSKVAAVGVHLEADQPGTTKNKGSIAQGTI